MIVIAGGTGRLGRILVERLAARREPVRILSRTPGSAGRPLQPGVEIVQADVRDPDAVDRAVAGARVVISAMSAFGMDGVTPRDVDSAGNANLITAAEKHGVERFVLVSDLGASAQHPMELARMKYLAEQRLTGSTLSWTILRPSTYIETFQAIVCAPLLSNDKAIVFGRGQNPINFVSAHDVARFVEFAASDAELSGKTIEMGGIENLSLIRFVDIFARAIGVTGSVKHIPRLAMRLGALLARPFNPKFARMAQAGLLMDSTDMSFDVAPFVQRYPQFHLTTVAEAARRDYAVHTKTRTTTL
jgi:NADH dehydrogenase